MQPDIVQTVQAWAVATLVYPGLLFVAGLALVGEWLVVSLRPLWTPRLYRPQTPQVRSHHFLQPVNDFLKLAGRQSLAFPALGKDGLPSSSFGAGAVQAACAIAPPLAVALIPFPGNPLIGRPGQVGDLFTVLALLAVQPLCRAVVRLRTEGAEMRGARDVSRLAVGLFPVLIAGAALVEASASRSPGTLWVMTGLVAAPQTGLQFLVRVLAGAALLVALPLWLDARGVSEVRDGAGNFAGTLWERAALAALWAYLSLPAPGEAPWAVAVAIAGTLSAYVGMRVVGERLAAGRREDEAAGLAWAASLPVAAIALLAALWSGA